MKNNCINCKYETSIYQHVAFFSNKQCFTEYYVLVTRLSQIYMTQVKYSNDSDKSEYLTAVLDYSSQFNLLKLWSPLIP